MNDFPGRWAEGVSLTLAPVLMLAGVLLRVGYDGFFPAQLAAFAEAPVLMSASYGCFALGSALLWPGVLGLVRRSPASRLVLWGGVMVLCGLFARAFHAGVSHLALQLVDGQGLAAAQRAVAAAYGAFHVFQAFNVMLFAGWAVLAVALWRAGTLGPVRSVALGLMSALPMGVLKGTGPMSLLAVAGLCVALVPYGVKVLREGPAPRWWAVPLALAVGAGAVVLGTLG
ncbi:hypothetical protein [Nonomuraea roseoviolacea]|uniref:DUF4386 family protein n=1 Tax=Nonomuraea roseoviolacea subsp. carminata TaxID=160689 RepID=A0ABT1K226_9ACTN|nr:hypothetical protein [Nonomuraea roseoviolacea]MCP2347920.1 hypothetical protein [Nonomuraea roseoviolacea subsp. carminata]